MPRKSGTGGRSARRGGGLRALAATLPKVTGKAFGRRGLAMGGLIADWPSIIGVELAAVTLPRNLSRRGERTLTLRVESGFAPALQHLEPLVIERVNGYLGYKAVARLSLQQGPLPRPPAPTRQKAAPLTPAEEAELKARTAALADETLGAALERLGRAVRQQGARTGKA